MLLNEDGYLCLADLPRRNSEYKIDQLTTGRMERARVQAQKGQHGHETNPLVAVDKGMPLGQMEEIGRSHLGQAFM